MVDKVCLSISRPLLKPCAWLLLAALLAACTFTPTLTPNPKGALAFTVCQKATQAEAALPFEQRSFQGRDGWFFFGHDLRAAHPWLAQTAFIGTLARALKEQGTALVVVPVPGRALAEPQELYPGSPEQAEFSPIQAEAQYSAFLAALRAQGVAATDVLAATRRFGGAGGKPFFQRDIHWTPEGANAVAQDVAKAVTEAVGELGLPKPPLTLSKASRPQEHTGETLKRLLRANCGYILPSEPLYDYTVARAPESISATTSATALFGSATPEVALTGTSFSVAPYYLDFLAVALQSDVFNVSVSSGGAFIALGSYFLDGAYDAERPRAVVWEVPIWSPALTPAEQRQLLGSVPGACSEAQVVAQERATLGGATLELAALGRAGVDATHRLSLNFSDLSLLKFGVTLRYQSGKQTLSETLHIERSTRTINSGHYLFSLLPDPQAVLTGVSLEFLASSGAVTARLCREG